MTAKAATVTHDHIHIDTDSFTYTIILGKNCCTQRSAVTMSVETSSKVFLILSITLNHTSSFITLNLMPELLEMNAQTPLPNTKPATEKKSPS